MHAISSYRGNRPTNTQTHPQTHKQIGPITIHCAAASAQRNDIHSWSFIILLPVTERKAMQLSLGLYKLPLYIAGSGTSTGGVVAWGDWDTL